MEYDGTQTLKYERRAFPWRGLAHPFLQRVAQWRGLVAEHVVHGRVVFPGAGYLEMARAAANAAGLEGVFFVHPLVVEPGVQIECSVSDGRFEIRSSDSEAEATVYCIGGLASRAHARSGNQSFNKLREATMEQKTFHLMTNS